MTALDRFTHDTARHALIFRRRVAAPPEWVFAAWTDAALLRRWWDPTGTPLTECRVDLRIGGQVVMATADHADRPFIGTYTAIDPPHGLAFDAMGAHGTVSLRAEGAETEMVVEIRCPSAEHLAQMLQFGVAEGTAQTVDNLVALARS